ncbi:segregation and condensation protein A [Polynucleobacter sphagniphilus]|uniref:segregation and condensation protein A n=1 Tax=Polynucleobacter sphagniphilus TaxID=1743169 RepID=UPI002473D63E|nr:ScpA family protein [Polynucleobacter sphagniphilus]MDH6422070.1 segregation and condensation protein A [Polynucleobacter sphagniphilus]
MTEPSAQPISDLLDSTPSVTDGMSSAFAKLYGEPLFKLPTDLYIPPDALEVFPLEAFEGPLDLLLYLIRKQNFNVLDIPMAQVTQQYLSYIDQIRHHNLELAAEYLLMAAMLIEIKSRMLLPMKKADSDEEVEDPRAELVRRLLEYERMKLAAQELDQIPQQGRDFQIAHGHVDTTVAITWPEVNLDDLQMAWRDVLHRAKLNQHHTITREELSVRDFMTRILRRLQSTRFVEFGELFEEAIKSGKGVPVVIVNFIAMLELSREALVEITQAEPYAPIYVRLAYTPSA